MVVRYISPRARVSSVSASSIRILGLPGASTKPMAPQASSGGPVGSAGQLAAGRAGGGGCAGDGTTHDCDKAVERGAAVGGSAAASFCGTGLALVGACSEVPEPGRASDFCAV